MNIYKKIYKEIKNAKTIIIARHVGADPDALGSSLGLKQIILDNFKNKEVLVIGTPTARFRFIGELDKIKEDFQNLYDNALLIVTDTPDHRRVDGVDPRKFKKSIKIDHHPFVEQTCKIEWIDDKSSSASQMVLEFALQTKMEISKAAAEKLYTGIVADTNRFLFKSAGFKTFNLISTLLEKTNIEIGPIYDKLYMRPYKEIKFKGYMEENFNITKGGVGYIKIDDATLKKYNVDAAMPGNMINDFNYIEEMLIWVTFTEDKEQGTYRVSVRSRGPVINEVVARHGGGGHIYASGTRLKTNEEMDALIYDLDLEAQKYNE